MPEKIKVKVEHRTVTLPTFRPAVKEEHHTVTLPQAGGREEDVPVETKLVTLMTDAGPVQVPIADPQR